MLENRLTGELREVDVVIRAQLAGQLVVVAVEATMQRAGSPWVESMLQKHAELPTDRLVLVAERGFSRGARKLAEARGASAIAPEELADLDGAASIVLGLESATTMSIAMLPTRVCIDVMTHGGEALTITDASGAVAVSVADGQIVGDLNQLVEFYLGLERMRSIHALDLADSDQAQAGTFRMTFGDAGEGLYYPLNGFTRPLYVQIPDREERARLMRLTVEGDYLADSRSTEVHRERFDTTPVAHATSNVFEVATIQFVLTEADNVPAASLRIRALGEAKNANLEAALISRRDYGREPSQHVDATFAKTDAPPTIETVVRAMVERLTAIFATSTDPADELLPSLVVGTRDGLWSATLVPPHGDAAGMERLQVAWVPEIVRARCATSVALALETWIAPPEDLALGYRPSEAPHRQTAVWLIAADRMGKGVSTLLHVDRADATVITGLSAGPPIPGPLLHELREAFVADSSVSS